MKQNGAIGFVASFTDAWIETQSYSLNLPPLESHLLQMRGLKLSQLYLIYPN